MKVCDRHPTRRASESVHIERDDAHFDLCAECKTDLISFLCTPVEDAQSERPPARRGRPPKNSAIAE